MKILKIFLISLFIPYCLQSINVSHFENGRDHLDYIDALREQLGKEPIDCNFYNKSFNHRFVHDVHQESICKFLDYSEYFFKNFDTSSTFYFNDSLYSLSYYIPSIAYAEFIKYVLVGYLTDTLESGYYSPGYSLKKLDNFVFFVLDQKNGIIKNSPFHDLTVEQQCIIVYISILVFSGYLNYADEVFFYFCLRYYGQASHIKIEEIPKFSLKSWIKSFFHRF